MPRTLHAYPSTPWPTPWATLPPHPARRAAARSLRRLGAWLARTARLLAAPAAPPTPGPLPVVEYSAEAGAPEGALFIDGVYIGRIGVSRL